MNKRCLLFLFALVSGGMSSQVLCASDPSRLDGEINPEFQGRSYSRFVVSAVNVVPAFRKQLEAVTVSHIDRATQVKGSGREFRAIFPSQDFIPGKSYAVAEVKQKMLDEQLEIFVFINVKDTGGNNLDDIDSLDNALLVSANHEHDPAKAEHYGFTDVVMYELATGKIVWRGNGIIKAKPNTPKWFKRTAVGHAKYFEKHIIKRGLVVRPDKTSNVSLHE